MTTEEQANYQRALNMTAGTTAAIFLIVPIALIGIVKHRQDPVKRSQNIRKLFMINLGLFFVNVYNSRNFTRQTKELKAKYLSHLSDDHISNFEYFYRQRKGENMGNI